MCVPKAFQFYNTAPRERKKELLLRENLFLRNLHLVSGWTCYRESLRYLFLLGHQGMPPSSPWWWGPLWEEDCCSLMLGFPEPHNIAIHFHLRTENCLEKPTVETQYLILASAQRDHLSCFYGKLVSAWIWLEALSKLCVALGAVSSLCSHQINFSLGWLSPRVRPVLIPVVFLSAVAHFFYWNSQLYQ